MLQQTQFKTIIPYYERWKKVMIAVSGPFHRDEINLGSHSTGHH
jgi:hypothetical protein